MLMHFLDVDEKTSAPKKDVPHEMLKVARRLFFVRISLNTIYAKARPPEAVNVLSIFFGFESTNNLVL